MTKKKRNILFYLILITLVISIILLVPKTIEIKEFYSNPENRKAMTYNELTEQDKKVENCDYVEFSSFFTRDIDRDGYAERLDGTCKEIGDTDTLYAEINVLTQGVLKDAKITLNGENFTWTTAIVEDNFIAEDYIGETSEIKLKDISNGSQKLLWGTIKSKLENNINDYSKVNSITLTGTYYDEAGRPTKINKTVNLTVDWYSKTETAVNKYYYSATRFTSYQNQSIDIATAITDTSVDLTFKVAISEMKQNLLLQKQVAEITIPELNGYKALEVNVAEKNIVTNYNEETGILTITRESELDENGNLTKIISKSNINNVTIKYPLEAYNGRTTEVIVLNVPIVGYNYIYNNQDKEFDELRSSRAEGILTVTYAKTHGEVWNLYTSVGNNENVSGTDTYRYQVSKEQTTNIYNGNTYEEGITTYPVKWEVIVGDYTKINKITLEEDKENQNNKTDKFLNTSGTYSSMYDYIKTTGVYFSNATSILGKEGWIKLYNGETGSLLETFTSSNWECYTKDKPYNIDLKSIKIETSEPIANTTFAVYQIKEIDDELLSQKLTKEEFEKLSYIYTYVSGQVQAPLGVTYDNGTDNWKLSNLGYAYYEMPYSVAKISITPNEITNQKTESIKFMIDTLSASSMEKQWKNGVFLIELPENIICVNLNDIEISDSKVKITASEILEENGKYFIKVYTRNEEETTYKITIDAEIAANPLETTSTKPIKLYAYNEICNNYYNQTEDIYDISTTDNYVGVSNINITAIAPSGLLTTEYVTDYDDLGNRTIAPNVAEIEKSDEQRTATINVSLTNSYNGTISDIKVLGKTPFEGNTYVLNGKTLNSRYTANITGEIKVPEKLKKFAKVYYSSNENPTKALDESNNWKTAGEVTDWSEIRTYLIDLGEYKLAKEENVIFTYDVMVPAGLGYNKASFSTHGVYFNLDTENGKLSTQTEPNKVGIKVAKKYSLELIKNKHLYENMKVKGATYSVETTGDDGKIVSNSAITNEDGCIVFKKLYVEKEYILKEIASTDDYALSDDEIKFKTHINDNGELIFEVISGSFKNTPNVTIDEKNNYLVKAKVEDESNYTLVINKVDDKGERLPKIKFSLVGKNKTKVYKTDKDGKIVVSGLYLGERYRLQEIEANGYYIDQAYKEFKLERDENGIIRIITDDEVLQNMDIEEVDGVAQATATVTITNEKIPTYNLQILKVIADEEEDVEKLTKLEGAYFSVESDDIGNLNEYRTDENGKIDLEGLYLNVEGKYITGKYTIKETKAPSGYSNNAEKIELVVKKNSDGSISAEIANKDKLISYKNVIIDGNTVKLVLQDKPLFKLTKVDSETGARLANAKFIIWELDESGSEVDYAKDVNGNYVGEKNVNGECIVVTDENGTITLPLRNGIYKAVEVGFPDGYLENDNFEIFKVSDGKDEGSQDEETNKDNIIEISCIEELVDIANQVNSGNSYKGYTIRLTRDLNLDQVSSYRASNGNDYIENIMTKLTTGSGWTPIGSDSEKCFEGVFDGCGHTIANLYINSGNQYVGLFGYINNAEVKNLKVTGNIYNDNSNGIIGGIVGYANCSTLDNCSVNAQIERDLENAYDIRSPYNGMYMSSISYSENKISGGIVGQIEQGYVKKCINFGNVNGNNSIGGIAGIAIDSDIMDCYNKGKLCGSRRDVVRIGGIVGGCSMYWSTSSYSDTMVKRSCNEGKIYCYSTTMSGNYVGGIIGGTVGGIIEDCYNNGDILGWGMFVYIGGIVGETKQVTIRNCYNMGDLEGYNCVNAILGGTNGFANSENFTIQNCYYSESIQIVGCLQNFENSYGNCISDLYMKSEDFYNTLNIDRVWSSRKNGYPTLLSGILASTSESTEISINNTIKKYKVTTDVQEVNGIRGGEISGEEEGTYETINIYDSNKKEIVITPDTRYAISKITINGKEIDYKVDENGCYKIPIGYFENVQEDKKVIVTFSELGQSLIINKVDEENEELGLSDAKFKITKTDTDKAIENSARFNERYNTSNVIASTIGSGRLGNMTNNGTYYFERYGSYYRSTNYGKQYTDADSYIKVDLTGLTGRYAIVVNAYISADSSSYGYAWITQSTDKPSSYTSTDQFINISGSTSSKDYTSTIVEGGSVYYIHFKYERGYSSSGSDRFFINSVKVIGADYDTYYFEENNGKLISNNKTKSNTTANSYVPIDLTNMKGTWDLIVNAEISSEKNYDYGYSTITQSTSRPSYNSETGRFIYISGIEEAKDYSTPLEGGKKYYLHLGYYKDGSNNIGSDCFTINSIKLSTEAKTNSNGKIILPTSQGKYQIEEIEAPKGYTLNSEPKDFQVVTGQDNTLTITNQKQCQVVVHHYLKNADGTYTTAKVAEDEFYEGDIGTDYTTNPHIDLEKLTLEKDNDGKFKRPENASGKYTQEKIEVIYYYEAEPIELKIHHYLNGTQNKLVQDDIIHVNPEVRFDENGNYEVVCVGSYSLADNEKYNNLIKQYNLVNLSTTVQENVEISDTIKYNTDSELSYYYELKEYTITTKVELHPELRTDELTNEKVELLVEGGKISGQGEEKYEVVVHGENSSKEIVITPYEGYTIEKVTLNSINDAGETTTTILYGENRAIDAEVTCIENEDGSMSLISANSSSGSLFQNVVENKEIIVKLAPNVGTIIVHHYFEGTGEEFNTLPERIILPDGTICNDEVKTEIIGENYATKAFDGSEVMYELVSTSGETNGKVTEGEKHVYYYYKRIEQKITTEVIKHEEIDEAGNTSLVKGGSISGEDEAPYETVLKFDDSTKEIKIIPEETYQIKKVLVNGEEISFDKILDDKSLILDKFESVAKDIHVAVEFEKIPTKVIIKYIDEETEKEISEQDIIEGIINKKYETNLKTIEGYELQEEKLPENAKGIMTEDDIIVIYYYKKAKAPVEEPKEEITQKPIEEKPTENQDKSENESKEEQPGKVDKTPERKEEEKSETPEVQKQTNLPKVLIKTGQSRAMIIGLVIIITSIIIAIIIINKKQK